MIPRSGSAFAPAELTIRLGCAGVARRRPGFLLADFAVRSALHVKLAKHAGHPTAHRTGSQHKRVGEGVSLACAQKTGDRSTDGGRGRRLVERRSGCFLKQKVEFAFCFVLGNPKLTFVLL